MATITVNGLRKSYGGNEVLRGLDFEVEANEVFGFLGPNGAGKTTTIEILEGYRERSGGEVSVLGTDPGRPARAWRERIGLVLQQCELGPLLTVAGTLEVGKRADLTAYAVDPLVAPPDELVDAPIVLTVVDGAVSHRGAQVGADG